MSSVDRALAVVLVGVLLPACGACSQRWELARPGDPTYGGQLTGFRVQGSGFRFLGSPFSEAGLGHRCVLLQPPPAPVISDQPSRARPSLRAHLRSGFQELRRNIRSDYRNYYCWVTMRDLLYGVAGASVLANTNLDEDFQNWYQRDVRSSGCDDFAAFWKTFGEGQIFIPAFAGLGLVGSMFEDRPLLGTLDDFGDRVARGCLVGVPPMLFMQYCLGSSRPNKAKVGSRWKPFDDDSAVSGHAFIGAVPFITAAKMTENPWAKNSLYICSTFTAWSRVNDDDHYLSQAILGWYMAYLACRAVDDTEQVNRCFSLTPMVTSEVAGVAAVWRR